jgi:hypothetical protein
VDGELALSRCHDGADGLMWGWSLVDVLVSLSDCVESTIFVRDPVNGAVAIGPKCRRRLLFVLGALRRRGNVLVAEDRKVLM